MEWSAFFEKSCFGMIVQRSSNAVAQQYPWLFRARCDNSRRDKALPLLDEAALRAAAPDRQLEHGHRD
jgi:hypothetical protein